MTLRWDRPNRKTSDARDEHILLVRLQPVAAVDEHLPVHVAIALDTSGSMQNKLADAIGACRKVIESLRDGDRLSLAGFSDVLQPLFERASRKDLPMESLCNLTAGGVTRMDLALEWMSKALGTDDAVSLGILITDGKATDRTGTAVEEDQLRELQAAMAAIRGRHGTSTCAIGVGTEAEFETRFLDTLGDFLYASTLDTLGATLQSYLSRAQGTALTDVEVKFDCRSEGGRLTQACRILPSHQPLELAHDGATPVVRLPVVSGTEGASVLARVSVPALSAFAAKMGPREVVSVTVRTRAGELAQRTASINFVNTLRLAAETDEDVERLVDAWRLVIINAGINCSPSPTKTAELLDEMIELAKKSNDSALLNSVRDQQKFHNKTGELDAGLVAKTTSELRGRPAFGSQPVPARRAREPARTCLRRVGSDGQFPLAPPRTQVGRGDAAEGNQIDLTPLESRDVPVSSRRHAAFEWKSERLLLQDLESKNGTFVNGDRLLPGTAQELHIGDRIRFGNIEFEILESAP